MIILGLPLTVPTQRAIRFASNVAMVFLVVTVVTFVGLRLYSGYVMQARMAVLEQRVVILDRRIDVVATDMSARYHELEAAIFGDIEPKVNEQQQKADTAAPQRSRVELWQLTRDKELRDRIQSLEQSRMELRAQIRQLEAIIRDER